MQLTTKHSLTIVYYFYIRCSEQLHEKSVHRLEMYGMRTSTGYNKIIFYGRSSLWRVYRVTSSLASLQPPSCKSPMFSEVPHNHFKQSLFIKIIFLLFCVKCISMNWKEHKRNMAYDESVKLNKIEESRQHSTIDTVMLTRTWNQRPMLRTKVTRPSPRPSTIKDKTKDSKCQGQW